MIYQLTIPTKVIIVERSHRCNYPLFGYFIHFKSMGECTRFYPFKIIANLCSLSICYFYFSAYISNNDNFIIHCYFFFLITAYVTNMATMLKPTYNHKLKLSPVCGGVITGTGVGAIVGEGFGASLFIKFGIS